MKTANNLHRTAAVMRALDLPSRMPAHARLWLALASARADTKGRTTLTPDAYAVAANDQERLGQSAIAWLLNNGIILNDHHKDGTQCWRLTHHDWDKNHNTKVEEYHPNAGQHRDGLPPAYGRNVNDVIEPNGPRHTPPPIPWREQVTNKKEPRHALE